MKFLNGFKTVIGLVGTVVTVVFPKMAPDVVATVGDGLYGVAQGVFVTLAALGVIHKVEKAADKR